MQVEINGNNIEVTQAALAILDLLVDVDNIIVFDTETTGFSKQCQVIELAMYDAITDETYHSELYKPSVPINYGAMKVHGINAFKVAGKQPFTSMDAQIILNRAQGEFNSILTGWNISFDKRLILQTIEAHSPEYDTTELLETFDTQTIDMMEVVKQLTGKKMSQEKALKFFGITPASTIKHRALDDCMNLAALNKVLLEAVKEL